MCTDEQPLKLTNSNGRVESFYFTYETLLTFVTGAPRPPPYGFQPKPSLAFYLNRQLPRANTCANTLYLPLQTELPTFEQFSYDMVFGILNSAGFQRV